MFPHIVALAAALSLVLLGALPAAAAAGPCSPCPSMSNMTGKTAPPCCDQSPAEKSGAPCGTGAMCQPAVMAVAEIVLVVKPVVLATERHLAGETRGAPPRPPDRLLRPPKFI